MDAFDPHEPYSRIYFRNERAPNLWVYNQHDFVIPSVCLAYDPMNPGKRIFVAIGEDGQVVFLGPQQRQEQIADAGLRPPSGKGLGYVSCIRQIGERLYACGYSGQVYRRDDVDDWKHMDQGILQPPAMTDGEYAAQIIDGPDEQAIYLAGAENLRGYPPRADFWNGHEWRGLELPPSAGRITNMHIESDERVWLCGARGTLLLGNAAEGFVAVSPSESVGLISSVTRFRDLIYVGTNQGLYSLDPTQSAPLLEPVHTDLQPELTDANIVQGVDDEVLWSMGPKDIARFDGARWERFHHPDNPRIGA